MAKPNDYFVIQTTELDTLARDVGIHLDRGCELVGGVSISYNPDNKKMYYAQAMIDKQHNT